MLPMDVMLLVEFLSLIGWPLNVTGFERVTATRFVQVLVMSFPWPYRADLCSHCTI